MNILNRILKQLPTDPIPVQQVLVGIHWTMVCSKYCGLGSTLTSNGPHGYNGCGDAGNLHGKTAQELAEWVLSDNLLEASIGITAINSLMEIDDTHFTHVNASEVIAIHANGKNLTIIGHFPFVERLKSQTKNCWIIEKRPIGSDLPESAAWDYIPQSDVVAITGTALINHTMEGLLALCRPDSFVIVLGPSTPLTPLLFDYGVDIISGARVIDREAALITISQGATFQQVRGVKLITMAKGG